MARWLRRLLCLLMGWHEYWSYADQIQTAGIPEHLQPKAGDSIAVITIKFKECSLLRCKHCPYTYGG